MAKDEAGMVCLEPTKMKDAELPTMQAFKLAGVKLPLMDDDGNYVWGAALEAEKDYQAPQRGKAGRGKNQAKALTVLRELYHGHRERLERGGADPDTARVRVDDWRDALANEGIGRTRFYDLRTSLERARSVRFAGPYVELVEP